MNTLAARLRLWKATHRLYAGLVVAALLALGTGFHITPDTWWHLRTGAWIVQHHRLPTQDLWSYTRYGASWSPPGWPVQIGMYALYRLGGLAAVNLTVTFLFALTYLPLYAAARGGPGLRATVVLLAAITGLLYRAARPYMVTTLFTAWFLWALETWHWDTRDRRLLALLPAMALWANTHAGFVSGFLLWAAYFAEALTRWFILRKAGHPARAGKLALLGAGLLAAACLNPQGPGRLLYPLATLRLRHLSWIAEWQSPDFTRPATWPFLLWWMLLVAVLATGKARLPLRHILLWLGFGVLGFRAVRNIPLFALVAAVVGSHATRQVMAAWRKTRPPRPRPLPSVRKTLNRTLVALAWLLALVRLFVFHLPGHIQALVTQSYPVAAVTYLSRTHPPGRLFNSYNWGGYLLWALPDYPVFIDGRTDLYGDACLEAWMQVVQAEPGWEVVLDRWQVGIVLLEPHWPLTKVLPYAGWSEVYRDGQSVVFLRAGRAVSLFPRTPIPSENPCAVP